MKKIICNILLIFIVLNMSSCTKKTIYFTPEFTGYIYNNKTKLPLKNVIGYIGVDGSLEDDYTKLNDKGVFIIPAKTKDYYLSRPNIHSKGRGPAELFFNFPNYKRISIDYSTLYSKQVPEEIAGFDHLNQINMGIIYLDPE